MAGSFAFLTPKPRPNSLALARRALGKLQASATQTQSDARKAENDVRNRTWSLPPEELGRRVMDDVGRIAERRKLGVANFQAGRTVEGAGLRQLAFSVTVEGAFLDVLDAVDDLEKSGSRLAVGNVSVAPESAKAGEPGRVSASIGLTAFTLRKEDE